MKRNPSRDISAQSSDRIDTDSTIEDGCAGSNSHSRSILTDLLERDEVWSNSASLFTISLIRENRLARSTLFRFLYKRIKKGIGKPAMALFPILLLYSLYNPTLIDRFLTPLSLITGLLFPTVGALYESDLEEPRVLTYRRVSTTSQLSASLPHQKEMNERAVERMNGVHVGDIKEQHTGTELDRRGINQIEERAEKDEFDVLAVTEIDRLTRAEIFDSIRLFEEFSEQDVTLYVNSIGVIDWDELFDLDTVFREAIFARRWIDRIHDGAESSYIEGLEQGKWPYNKAPFGYETDEDNFLYITKENEKIIRTMFDLYLEFENRSKTVERLNELFEFGDGSEGNDSKAEEDGNESEEEDGNESEEEDGNESEEEDGDGLSDSQVKTLLTSRLCIGQLCIGDIEEDGSIVAEKSDLQVVDREIFDRVQDLLEERSNRGGTRKFPESLNKVLERFGLDYLVSNIDALTYRCQNCNGEFEKYGSGEVMGELLTCYKCEECGHQATLFQETEFQEFHQTLPLRCPHCPRTGDFEWEEVYGSFGEYLYTCQNCGYSFKSKFEPGKDKIRRGLEHPDLSLDIDNSSSSTQEPTHSHTPSMNGTTDIESTDPEQTTLSGLTDGVQ